MSTDSSTADHLTEMIGKVRAEKAKVDIQRRHTEIHSRNEKAQRLVKRLQDCDGNIVSLLSQAADCLQSLITTAAEQSSSSGRGRIREIDDHEERLATFEARAQEWYATLHDVQIGLRSAARNLRKVQQTPLSMQASMQQSTSSSGSSSSQTRIGSATKGHSLGIALSEGNTPISMSRRGSNDSLQTVIGSGIDTDEEWHHSRRAMLPSDRQSTKSLGNFGVEREHDTRTDARSLLGHFVDGVSGSGIIQMQNHEFQDEIKLSLSALRQQERGWKELADALKTVASERKSDRSSIMTEDKSRTTEITRTDKEQEMRQIEADMTKSFATADKRLMGALMHLYMEVLPETSITPVDAPKLGQST